MNKKLKVDKIDIRPDGVLHVRLVKQILDIDNKVTASEYHRFTIEPFMNHQDLLNVIENALATNDNGSWPSLSGKDKALINQIVRREHTPEKSIARRAHVNSLNN